MSEQTFKIETCLEMERCLFEKMTVKSMANHNREVLVAWWWRRWWWWWWWLWWCTVSVH